MGNDCSAARTAWDAAKSEVERAERAAKATKAPNGFMAFGASDLMDAIYKSARAVEDARQAGKDADNAALAFDLNGVRSAYRRAKVAADRAEAALRRVTNTKGTP